jgi:xylan 1,4-beta-xylosidase
MQQYGLKLIGAVSWSFEFENQPWFAGFRDLATNGVDKPVLNVFRMFGMMKGNLVETKSDRMYDLKTVLDSGIRGRTDIGALASKDKNTAAVMLWNYHDVDTRDAGEPLHIKVNGLPVGKVTMTEYRIDAAHSNSYEVWKKMGSPQNPTPGQITQLEKAGQLQAMESPKKVDVNGTLDINLSLPRQGVSLLKFDW